MDLSKWTNIQPDIKFKYTNKRFYNKFFFKIVYQINYASSIGWDKDELISHLYRRVVNSYKSEDFDRVQDLSFKNLCDNLLHLKAVIDTIKKDKKRVRIENKTVAFFDNNLDELYQLAIGPLQRFLPKLQVVSVLANDTEKQLLENNYVILRNDLGYTYRVNIRSGFYPNTNNLVSVRDYIEQIKNEVRIGKNLLSSFNQLNKYLNGGYFYVNDVRLVDMIRLIEPTLVRSIQKVAVQ